MYPDAFVAEVLMYDRLVIPVVPTELEAPGEWARWEREGWDPQRQREIVECLREKLGDRIVEVPWIPKLQQRWPLSLGKYG